MRTVPNHRSRGKTVGERMPQCQLWGLLASGRSTLGPLSCGRGFLERKFEYVMDVGSVQHTFNSTNGQYMRIHSVQSLWGILRGNWRRVDVSSPLEV